VENHQITQAVILMGQKPDMLRKENLLLYVCGGTMLKIKRVYESPKRDDGIRFLVERLWPRGIKKEELKMKAWLKDVSPSPDLRKWYSHDVTKWDAFQKSYRKELKSNAQAWKPILDAAKDGNVTLLYSARDVEHNSALVLKEFLEDRLG
jgi:uncharacterized protein YeaO (DUF488 family)